MHGSTAPGFDTFLAAFVPIAAGVFALMLAENEALTRDEALALVLSTADKINPGEARYDPGTGFSNKYGYGRINAAKAVQAAKVFRRYTQRGRPANTWAEKAGRGDASLQ